MSQAALAGSGAFAKRTADRRAWFGFLAMVIGNFMAVLDIQIVASSINQLQAGLAASADEIQWIQTSYLIAEVIAIPLSGYLSRMLSTRVYFVVSAVGFTLASAACALSWNLGSMIVFRVLQGFLGGGMIPTTFATLFILFPADRRSLPQVLAGMTTMLAPALGPTLGGYLTDTISWHWLFLVNLLPGLLCGWAVWRLIRIDRPQMDMLKHIDLWGVLFMAMFLGGMEYALDKGPRKDWLSDDGVALFSVVAVSGGVLFFWRMFTAKNPIVDLRAFRDRNFAIGAAITAVFGLSMYTLVYLTPLFLGEVRGYNPLQIGQVMMVQGATMLLTAPIAGRIMQRRLMSPRTMLGVGLLMAAGGSWINARLTADWGIWQFALPQAVRGFGFLFGIIPISAIALGAMPADQLKNASGLFNVMRNIGGAIGLALINTLINDRTWLHWQELASSFTDSRAPVREALRTTQHLLAPSLGGDRAGALALLARQVQQQAAVLSFNDLFEMLSLLTLSSLLLLPLIRTPKSTVAVAAAH